MNGVLFVNKPEGWTSRDVVNKIGCIFGTKKVGHTGTLDPLATGVLVICLGNYTKLVEKLTSSDKEYLVNMHLGIKTDTADITGNILDINSDKISKEVISSTFLSFPREYSQKVPMYSAVKVQGKKLYEYAREGTKVSVPSRSVKIYKLELLNVENQEITFLTTVSKGTYIRSLVEDLAFQMGTFGTMYSLKRVRSGNILLRNCFELDEITKDTPLKQLEDLFDYPRIDISSYEYHKVLNGNKLNLNHTSLNVMLYYDNQAIAIYEKNGLEYKMVFKVV